MLVANASNLTSTPLSSSFKSEIQNEPDSARVDRKGAGLLELNFLVSRCFQAFINSNDSLAIRDSKQYCIEVMGIDEKERGFTPSASSGRIGRDPSACRKFLESKKIGTNLRFCFGTSFPMQLNTAQCGTSRLMRFAPSGFDDTCRAFTLAQHEARELGLRHVHWLAPVLGNPVT
jgi:hypothetical protein